MCNLFAFVSLPCICICIMYLPCICILLACISTLSLCHHYAHPSSHVHASHQLSTKYCRNCTAQHGSIIITTTTTIIISCQQSFAELQSPTWFSLFPSAPVSTMMCRWGERKRGGGVIRAVYLVRGRNRYFMEEHKPFILSLKPQDGPSCNDVSTVKRCFSSALKFTQIKINVPT